MSWELEFGKTLGQSNSGRREAAGGERKKVRACVLLAPISISLYNGFNLFIVIVLIKVSIFTSLETKIRFLISVVSEIHAAQSTHFFQTCFEFVLFV